MMEYYDYDTGIYYCESLTPAASTIILEYKDCQVKNAILSILKDHSYNYENIDSNTNSVLFSFTMVKRSGLDVFEFKIELQSGNKENSCVCTITCTSVGLGSTQKDIQNTISEIRDNIVAELQGTSNGGINEIETRSHFRNPGCQILILLFYISLCIVVGLCFLLVFI